jgi:hypothetical protein
MTSGTPAITGCIARERNGDDDGHPAGITETLAVCLGVRH